MDRTVEILTCDTVESLPTIQQIMAIPRERALRVIFSPSIQELRETVGTEWKRSLSNFVVGIHMIEPEINIRKLISYDEIVEHSSFFEQCAKDYRNLATQLIYELAAYFNEKIDPENAMHTFGKFKRGRQSGVMGLWEYRLHGSDCLFENSKTGQTLEVYLITQLEFGILDPYFFIDFIATSENYHPLPIEIYKDYCDGERILDKMLEIGKFERISSFFSGPGKIVVRDRSSI